MLTQLVVTTAHGVLVALPDGLDPTAVGAAVAQLHATGPYRDPAEDPDDALLLDALRGRFLALLPQRTTAVREAADPRALADAVHRLAGSSAQFGYPGLATLCRIATALARAGDTAPEVVGALLVVAQHVQTQDAQTRDA